MSHTDSITDPAAANASAAAGASLPLEPNHAPRFASDIAPELILWSELFPGGGHWSYRVRRGTSLRFVDVDGGANASILLYRADERLERLNIPDTLKGQHTAHLTRGHGLYSDMGNVMASITEDTLGWHDALCGVSDADSLRARYGEQRYQEHRNAMQRNGKDSLLIEIGKWGLGLRDLMPNVNLFSKVTVDADGRFHFASGHAKAGGHVTLRIEMDCLIAIATAPHPLDPSPVYAPKKVGLVAWRSGPVPADDFCRLSSPENTRAFLNTDMIYR